MKLSALITESSINQWNSELESIILSQGSNTTAEEITKFQQVLDKVVELTKFKVNNIESVGRFSILVSLSNGLLDAHLAFYMSIKDGAIGYAGIKMHLTLNDAVKLQAGKSEGPNELVEVMKFNANVDEFEQEIKPIIEYIDDFNKWYFEMSGEFGQVKLFVTSYNVLDGYHRGGDKRIVAYAGDFIKSGQTAKAKVYK